jgi:hypothetical protein
VQAAEFNVLVRTILALLVLTATLAEGPKVEIATTIAFTEGPTLDREGNVYFTDTIRCAL